MDRSTSSAVRKGAWTKEEDDLLRECVHKNGEGKWHLVPQRAGLKRCRKSCRLRWMNYLKPTIKRGDFEEDEVDLIMRLHRLLGNRWSLIAGRLPGRTPNDVKNFFHTHLKKLMVARENDHGNYKWMNNAIRDDRLQLQLQSVDPLPIKPQPTTLVNTTTPLLTTGTTPPSDGNYYPNFAEINLVAAMAPAAADHLNIPSSPENWTEWWANLMVDLENNEAPDSWDEGEAHHDMDQYCVQLGEKLVE